MQKQILEFNKSQHFLFSQWDRKISDQILNKILPFVECEASCNKKVVIVVPSFLKSKDIDKGNKDCLILIIKQKYLITGYWCNHPNYLFKKSEQSNYQLIY